MNKQYIKNFSRNWTITIPDTIVLIITFMFIKIYINIYERMFESLMIDSIKGLFAIVWLIGLFLISKIIGFNILLSWADKMVCAFTDRVPIKRY